VVRRAGSPSSNCRHPRADRDCPAVVPAHGFSYGIFSALVSPLVRRLSLPHTLWCSRGGPRSDQFVPPAYDHVFFLMIDLTQISRNLEQTAEGEWHSKLLSAVSYPEWGNQACFDVEDSSFWFRHRNACILEALSRFPPAGPLFDIGGGNGFVAKAMQGAGLEVVLVEPGAAGTVNARRRGIQHVVRATLEDAGFIPGSLPAIGLFDVVEHMEDDRKFLQTIRIHLSSRGRIYLTVPAYQALWSGADVVAGHYRRYSRRALREILERVGFEVEFATGFFQFLPPAILAMRVIPYRLGVKTLPEVQDVDPKMVRQHKIKSELLGRTINWMQQREVSGIRERRENKFGASWLIVARKVL
jgi:SAM-dependent methyltransferase